MKTFVGIFYAFIPGLITGLIMGWVFQSWLVGIALGGGVFCAGLDVIFRGSE